MKPRILSLIALGLLSLRVSQAAEMPNSGEVAIAWSSVKIDTTLFTQIGLTVAQKTEHDMGFAVRYGRQLVGPWGIEVAYADSGFYAVRGTDSAGLPWSVHINPVNWTLGGTYAYPVNERLKLSARFGGLAYEDNFGKSFLVKRTLPDQERGVGLYYGAGAAFKIANRFQLTATIDRYNGVEKTTMLSAGLRLSF